MSLLDVFDIAGSAMSAQSVGGAEDTTYHARHPVFSAVMQSLRPNAAGAGVRIDGIYESQDKLEQQYQPDNPLANEQGYVFLPNVNMVDEMANMISASRSYQSNVEVLNTSKQMMLATLRMGQ